MNTKTHHERVAEGEEILRRVKIKDNSHILPTVAVIMFFLMFWTAVFVFFTS
jgi:hypothetical protein